MTDYMGKIHALFHEFNELLPPSPNPATEIEQRSKFFMLEGLHGLADKYSHIRDQILGSPIVPTLNSTCSTLLRVPNQPNTDTPASVDDSSTLASHRDDHTCPCKQGKKRPKCEHCGKPGHKIDKCYALHGRPPRSIAVVQTNLSPPSSTGILLLFHPVHLLCSTNFSSGIRINSLLVSLHLSLLQVHLLLI